MMKKKKYVISSIIVLFLCCLWISAAGVAASGEASQKTVSITEFYNNGVMGDGYNKARNERAIVTISNVEEMKIFFNCLLSYDWTNGISFRQEKDISFGDSRFDYNPDRNRIYVYRDGICKEHYGVSMPMETVQYFGLEDAYFDLKTGRDFWGKYDGQGYSISGFVAANGGYSIYGGIFGYIEAGASIRRVKIKNCFLNHAWGALCGKNLGVIEDCSVEAVVGSSWSIGGIAYSNGGTIRRCRAENLMLCSAWGYGDFGGIAAMSDSGEISDCMVEQLKIKMVYQNFSMSDRNIYQKGLSAGGIVGCQRGGQIVNCSSIYEANCTSTGYERVGGIVGSLEEGYEDNYFDRVEYVRPEINNCISAGKLRGKTAGGIVGKIYQTKSVSEVSLKNNLSLAGVYGDVAGGVVGQLDAGKVTACYSYEKSKSLAVVGQKNSGNVVESYALDRAQVYGEPSANVIDAGSTYGNTKMLLTALNNGVAEHSDYAKWRSGVLGYPVLISNLEEAPAGNYELDSEIELSLPYQPNVTLSPSPTATASLTGTPDITASPSPTITTNITEPPFPTATTSPFSTEPPEISASPSPDITPGGFGSPPPAETAPPSNPEDKKTLSKKLAIKNLKIKAGASMHVNLSWKSNQWADGYQILRSGKGSAGYKVIGEASASKTKYVDKTAKRGRLYFYMVRGYIKDEGSTVYGNGLKRKVQIAWYRAPSLRLSAGKTTDGKSYVQIRISKYLGSYVEVYFKVKGKKYIKAPLKRQKIAFYNGKLRFSYKTKTLLYCKIRTYEIKKGKKQYSFFSKEKKIRL